MLPLIRLFILLAVGGGRGRVPVVVGDPQKGATCSISLRGVNYKYQQNVKNNSFVVKDVCVLCC